MNSVNWTKKPTCYFTLILEHNISVEQNIVTFLTHVCPCSLDVLQVHLELATQH